MKPDWCDEKTWETADYLFRCSSADVIALALRKAHQRGRREGMEEAADMIDHGFEKPVGKSYHPNFRSKHDQCPHGLYMYEDCEQCCSAAIRAKALEVT